MSGHPEGKSQNSSTVTYGTATASPGVVDPLAMVTVGGTAPNAASWPETGACEGVSATVRGGSGAGSA